MKAKKISTRKVKQFIENNFPPYTECTILDEKDDRVVALLDYGKREDKLKVTIGYSGEDYSLYRLLETNFVK